MSAFTVIKTIPLLLFQYDTAKNGTVRVHEEGKVWLLLLELLGHDGVSFVSPSDEVPPIRC